MDTSNILYSSESDALAGSETTFPFLAPVHSDKSELDQRWSHFVECMNGLPGYSNKGLDLAKRRFTEAMCGSTDDAHSLFLLLEAERYWILDYVWVRHSMRDKAITPAVFATIFRAAFKSGSRLTSLVREGFRLHEVVAMFSLADPTLLMTQKEREALVSMPDQIEIFRGDAGNTSRGVRSRMSWTIDLDIARRFTTLHHRCAFHATPRPEPQVWSGLIAKKDVLAFFDDRESEIVVTPRKIRNIQLMRGA